MMFINGKYYNGYTKTDYYMVIYRESGKSEIYSDDTAIIIEQVGKAVRKGLHGKVYGKSGKVIKEF